MPWGFVEDLAVSIEALKVPVYAMKVLVYALKCRESANRNGERGLRNCKSATEGPNQEKIENTIGKSRYNCYSASGMVPLFLIFSPSFLPLSNTGQFASGNQGLVRYSGSELWGEENMN
jgi:hypothetical protein